MTASSESSTQATLLFTWTRRLLRCLLVVACANLLYLLWRGSYDSQIGPLHLVAHGFFKPSLIFYIIFVVAILMNRPGVAAQSASSFKRLYLLPILGLIGVVWFFATSDINPIYDEWNYRGFSHDMDGRVWSLFTSSQLSAWYRPLGFLSLWVDSRVFGDHLWGYHIQNIAWHLLNAYLAGVLALRLRLSATVAAWATILFACAAVTYEPIMWPSARFDLLAMAFTAIALIASIDYLEQGSLVNVALATFSYTLAVMSKESGYAFPVLLVPIVFLVRPAWRTNIKRIATLASVMFVASALLLLLRFAVLQGIGGYPDHPGVGSPHLSFTTTTLQSLVTKLFPVTLLASNQMFPMPGSIRMVLGACALLLVASVFAGASVTPRGRWFALFAILSTGPVVTLVSWLDPAGQHVRYVYMPALFVMVMMAVGLSNARRSGLFLTAFVGLSMTVGVYNANAYRATYRRTGELAQFILADYKKRASPDEIRTDELPPLTHEFRVINMPSEFNGVLFSQFELAYRFEIYSTLVPFESHSPLQLTFVETANPASQTCQQNYCYLWQPETRDLLRLR